MRINTALLTVALLLSAWSATAGIPRTEAQKTIDSVCAREPLRSSLVGVLAVRMSGDTVAAVNPFRKLVPASNVKLLTTGLALNALGADHRFETRLGYTGEIVDGTLQGDLYILGGGDPTTGSRSDSTAPVSGVFAQWAEWLEAAGIRQIEGRLLGDPRYFGETHSQNLGWSYDDLGTNYGAGPQGLNFFENAQNFYITPGASVGAAPVVQPRYPDTPWMHFINHARTGDARSANSLYYVTTPMAPLGELAGSFPIDRRAYTLECSNLFGAYTCAWYFYNFLQTRGVPVSQGYGDVTPQGDIRTGLDLQDASVRAASPEEISVLGVTCSAPLADIVGDTNRDSNNFYAETLLRQLALRTGYGTDEEECRKAAEAALRGLGLRTDGACQQFDGSGLSRKNYVSPDFFVRFLRKMTTLPVWEPYFNSLPVPGAKGTLENRLPKAEQPLKDRIHMKSGSMNGVRCFSGYIQAADGDPSQMIVFSLLVNNCTAGSFVVMPVLDEIIVAIAGEN